MAVLLPGKFIYLATPHTASIATTRALATLKGAVVSDINEIVDLKVDRRFPKGTHHSTRAELRSRQPESFVGVELAVTTIRNPYDLLVTWWLRQKKILEEHTGREVTFRRFVETCDEGTLGGPYLRGGKIFWQDADYALRYEKLQDELDSFLDRFRIKPVRLDWTNVTAQKLPWLSYYDEETRTIVRHRFGDEIRSLGYRFLAKSEVKRPPRR
jgi:hypothetical protein